MAGISSYGVHIPRLRMPLSLISAPQGKTSATEKTVAGFDEDVVTMAVAAATDCLRNQERSSIDHIYLASTSSPFAEKSAAAIVAKALNLRGDVLAADYGGSLRACATALRAAINAVLCGAAEKVLVIASDARTAPPYSAQDHQLGDAAVALLVTPDGALRFEADAVSSRQIFDVWREDGASTLRSWEERFVVQHGCNEAVGDALSQLMARQDLSPRSVDHFVCHAADARSHRGLARHLGFDDNAVVSPLFGRVGNCGTALVPMTLIQALARTRAGERLVSVFYGDGAHAISWVLDASLHDDDGLEQQLERRIAMTSYRQYLQCRGLDTRQPEPNPADGISATVSFREQDADISFLAARCNQCGTEQFPPARLCYRCFSRDDFQRVALSTRTGRLASFTLDHFFPSANPPVVAGMCEAEGGARIYLQMADYNGEPLRTGLPVEFVFRRIHQSGGKPAYFWKSRLLNAAQGDKNGSEAAP